MQPSSRRKPPIAEEPRRGPVGEFLLAHRAGLAALLVAGLAAGAGAFLWSRFGDRTRAHRDTVLLPEAVELRGVAPWVRADVRGEALHDASLDQGLPLDDPELQRRLARAFDMHPWVRRVVRVELMHPAAACIEVQCREPVAMVGWQGGLLAVDGEGVVLPSEDFTAEAAARYPKITGVESSPQGAAGFPWGDVVVEEAAAVAAAIGPEWQSLGLSEVRPVRERGVRMWELVGDAGRRILFGSAPGHEIDGEATAAAKLARLKAAATDAARDGRMDLTAESPAEPPPAAIPAG